MHNLSASILCVGTELTIGQIVNKNASWISQQLKQLGMPVKTQLVVPDDRKLILDGLNFIGHHSPLLFVTGGLGPTSDDFTRDLIAEWTHKALELNDNLWQELVEKLNARKFPVREFQKQQCFFPEGAEILTNSKGTAHGFLIQTKTHDIFVLPGPPQEIEDIWHGSIQAWLSEKTKDLDPEITMSWDTLGLGESEIAHLTENALKGFPVEIGYRVHIPYVEVKLTFRKSKLGQHAVWIQNLETALHQYIVAKNGEDLAEKFCRILSENKIQLLILDQVSDGLLEQRLSAFWKNLWSDRLLNLTSNSNLFKSAEAQTDLKCLKIEIFPSSETKIEIRISLMGKKRNKTLESHYRLSHQSERRKQHWSELAILEALACLKECLLN